MDLKIDVPDLNKPRIVVIGGGVGGISFIKALKGKGFQIVLLDRNNYHTFQPLLYQVATAGLEPDSIAFPLRKVFKYYNDLYFRMAEVHHIDYEAHEVHTNIGGIHYDYVIIATGSRTNFFGMETLKRFSMPLKTVVQALDLRSLMLQNFEKALLTSDVQTRENRMNFVIVGGGPTGVELAGALAELKRHILPKDYPELDVRKMQIHLVEAGTHLLAGLSHISREKAEHYLENLGVHVWLNTQVTDYNGVKVTTNTGKVLYARNFIWSAGVEGNIPEGIIKNALAPGNRIKVDEYCKIVGLENAYAVGDVAAIITEDFPKGHPMVAPVAMQMGALVAKNLVNEGKGKTIKAFVYNDKGSMATVGKNRAVVEVNKYKTQGAFAWFIWMFVHIISLIGFRNKMVVFVNWLWNYFNYDRGIRLIIRPFNRAKAKKVETEKVI